MSGLDGAAFKILRDQPFGLNSVGTAFVRVSKDRHGGVRAYGIDYDPNDGTHLVGEFVLDATLNSATAYSSVKVPSDNGHTTEPRGPSDTEYVRRMQEILTFPLCGCWRLACPFADRHPSATYAEQYSAPRPGRTGRPKRPRNRLSQAGFRKSGTISTHQDRTR